MCSSITNNEQIQASDPQISVWLLASAGTGKTKVLIDRVLKLILTGADPEKILCLSFTKAAANEIENRLQSTLLKWASVDARQLSENIKSLLPSEAIEIQPTNCLLLAQSISEKFKVYTIHAFCQELINKFLFELKLKYNTSIINKVQSNSILNIVKKEIFNSPNLDEFNQFKVLLKHYSYAQISSVIDKVFENFFLLRQTLNNVDTTLYDNKLKNIFNLNSEAEHEEILNTYLSSIPQIDLKCVSNESITSLDQEKLTLINRFLFYPKNVQKETWLSLLSIFLTVNKTKKIRLFSSTFIKENKEINNNLLKWQDIFLNTYTEIEMHNNYAINYAFFIIVKSIYTRFSQIKKEKGYIDYNDLIYYAQTLLSPTTPKEWTLYKLNNGFEHILIDEAQDTSKEQWQIIESLVQNFMLNTSSINNKTIFVVGDEKQSIYSFQGADLEHFRKMQTLFQKLITDSQETHKTINLVNCYRSSQVILDFVHDALSFANVKAKFQIQSVKLTSCRQNNDSCIELMPLIVHNANLNLANTSYLALQTLMQQTAKIIALQVFDILQKKITLPSTGTAVKPEDIMILVQRRGKLSLNIIAECKKLGINISSSGRLFLQDALIIMDIIALAKFVLFPSDNFNLACLLKSPFFGISEQDLNNLFVSNNKKSQTLISCLKNSPVKQFQIAYEELHQVQNLYKQTDLFTFFYIASSYLEKRVRNMKDNTISELHLLDEFLNVLNNFKNAHESSLQKFVQWFLENPIELNVKNQHNNFVKITTVHGAKGLEAPCVIIADANQANTVSDDIVFEENMILINRSIHSTTTQLINQKKKNLSYQEYLRLMYVAFTRCKDYLIIFGSGNDKEDELTWYNFAKMAMEKDGSIRLSKIFAKLGLNSKTFTRTNTPFNNFTQSNLAFNKANHCTNKDVYNPALDFKSLKNVSDNLTNSDNKSIPDVSSTNRSFSNILYSNSFNVQDNALSSFKDIVARTNAKPTSSKIDNSDSLQEGEKLHKLLEKIINGVTLDKIYSSPLFISLNEEKKNYIKQFLLSDLYKEISTCDKVYTEYALAYKCGKTDNKNKILRLDLLIFKDNIAKIIDYKTDLKPCSNVTELPMKYLDQILEYKKVVSKIYSTFHIEGYIFWLQNCSSLKVV